MQNKKHEQPTLASPDRKPSPYDIAASVIAYANDKGFSVSVNRSTLSVRKTFTPGDHDAYTQAEGDANTILGMVRMVEPGSVWGTDGASVGGHIGLTNGYMELHKSGCSKRVLSAIAKGI